jgi:hypothetical protein
MMAILCNFGKKKKKENPPNFPLPNGLPISKSSSDHCLPLFKARNTIREPKYIYRMLMLSYFFAASFATD